MWQLESKATGVQGTVGRFFFNWLVDQSVVIELGTQQGTQAGGTSVFTGRLLAQSRHGLALVGSVLGLD